MNNQNLKELFERRLEPCYFCIYCISSKIYVDEKNNSVNEKEVYTFFGCDLCGRRKFLTSIFVNDYESTTDYYDFFQVLKSKSLHQILYFIAPRNENLKKACLLSFPNTEYILSCYEPFYKVNKYVSRVCFENFFIDIKRVFLADDIKSYEMNLDLFQEKYGTSSFILDIVLPDLIESRKYYKYDIELRKTLFAYYFHRETIIRLTSLGHVKKHFKTLEEYLEVCLPLIQKIELRMYCSKKDWINLLDHVYKSKKDLLLEYL